MRNRGRGHGALRRRLLRQLAGRLAGRLGACPAPGVSGSSPPVADAAAVRCEIAADSWKAAILASSSEREAVADAAATRASNFERGAVIDGSPARPKKENPTAIATTANIATAAGGARLRLGRHRATGLEWTT